MAGDWIKMRADLQTHPKIVRMASALSADRLRVIGGLHAVWCLFDVHSEDGSLSGYTAQAVDDLIQFPGFSTAMERVKWLSILPDSLLLPEFDEHNGQSAKRRATETKRKRLERENRGPQSVQKPSAPNADKKRTREEKRREDITPPKSPKGEVEGFSEFYEAYPRKVARPKAAAAYAKAIAKAQPAELLAAVTAHRASEGWRKDAGKYIPHPATWLNEERWKDEGVSLPPSKPAEVFKPPPPLSREALARNAELGRQALASLRPNGGH